MNYSESPKPGAVKRAVEWISIQRKMDAAIPLKKLVNEAMLRFDLSPKDSDFLMSFYREDADPDQT